MAFKPISTGQNAEHFKFITPGDSLTGFYVGGFDFEIDGAPKVRHVFKTEKGDVSTIGSKALNDGLKNVKPNLMVRVTFTEKKKLAVGAIKLFSIEVDEEATLSEAMAAAVAALPAKPTAAAVAASLKAKQV